MDEPRSYLVTYIAGANSEKNPWSDIGEDPDLDQRPMMWGICRTNVRGWVHEGSEVFFLADTRSQVAENRYFVSARLIVEDRIDHSEAVRRFGGRPNVIVDELPPEHSVRDQVSAYL